MTVCNNCMKPLKEGNKTFYIEGTTDLYCCISCLSEQWLKQLRSKVKTYIW